MPYLKAEVVKALNASGMGPDDTARPVLVICYKALVRATKAREAATRATAAACRGEMPEALPIDDPSLHDLAVQFDREMGIGGLERDAMGVYARFVFEAAAVMSRNAHLLHRSALAWAGWQRSSQALLDVDVTPPPPTPPAEANKPEACKDARRIDVVWIGITSAVMTVLATSAILAIIMHYQPSVPAEILKIASRPIEQKFWTKIIEENNSEIVRDTCLKKFNMENGRRICQIVIWFDDISNDETSR